MLESSNAISIMQNSLIVLKYLFISSIQTFPLLQPLVTTGVFTHSTFLHFPEFHIFFKNVTPFEIYPKVSTFQLLQASMNIHV